MAPVAAFRAGHGIKSYDPGAVNTRVLSFENSPVIRSNRLAGSAPWRPRGSNLTIGSGGSFASVRAVTSATPKLSTSRIRDQAAQSTLIPRLRAQTLSRHLEASIAPKETSLAGGERNREHGIFGDRTTTSRKLLRSLAPPPAVAREQAFLMERGGVRDSATIDDLRTGQTQSVPLAKEQPSSETDRPDQDQSFSTDSSNGDTGGPSNQNGPAVSTIHIDGSVLGRCAIQYLERALSKPTTGMTGVDPRASLPRSRIAPF
jgi:hypothetical protein